MDDDPSVYPDEAKYLKKRTKGGAIDVHPTDKALIVNYEVEATILTENGNPMVGEKKESQKIIRLNTLMPDTNIKSLAKEIINKCSLIHPSKIDEVEQLLYYLQNRKENTVSSSSTGKKKPLSDKLENPNIDDINETANINDLDDYAEMLYEDDMQSKIRGSALILQLARKPDNLEELFQNESILNCLSRVLKEEWQKSAEVSTNIIYTFFCFSTFSQFHPLVAHYKIGSLTLQIVEFELKRLETWNKELERRKAHINSISQQKGSSKVSSRQQYEQTSMSREDEKFIKELEKLIFKGEQLLRVSFYLLLNLAEDIKVEMKMINKNTVSLLVAALDRNSPDLLILIVSFLKKLSIFIENKNKMRDEKVVLKLARLVPHEQEDLLYITIRLLFNLSFDSVARSQMIKSGLLPKLVELLNNENQKTMAICILYHLSIDNKSKPMFTFTNCVDKLMKMIIESPNEQVNLELVALGINLALNHKCAAQMIEFSKKKGLKLLIKRAFKFKDALIMKMIRNISQHEETKVNFCEYIGLLGESIPRENNEEFLIELVGTLGNLNIADIDYEALLQEYGLIDWMKGMLQPNNAEDDLVLDIIVLIGAVCNDDACANMLSKSGIVEILINMLNAKQEDDEIVLQIVYVFYQMIFHKSTRELIIKKTQAPAYLIDLMNDKNPEVRRVCGLTLDTISEYDEEWAKKIQIERFSYHNSQWLEMIEGNRSTNMRYAAQMSANGKYGPNAYMDYGNQDDDMLENYLAVKDADVVTSDRMYANMNDAYYTETYPYDGRMSPDNFDMDNNNDEIEIGNETHRDNMNKSRAQTASYNRQYGYDPRASNNTNDPYDYYSRSNVPSSSSRPKTGRKYGVDSTYYLDDPND